MSEDISYHNETIIIITAGLVLAIINTFIKPLLITLSLPAIHLSLGVFTIIINGLTVFLASKVYSSLYIANFWSAVFAGMVIGLVNYLVTTILEDANHEHI